MTKLPFGTSTDSGNFLLGFWALVPTAAFPFLIEDMVSNFLADQEQIRKLMLRQNVPLAVVDFDYVGHIAWVDVDGLAGQLRNRCCATIISVEEVPHIRVNGPIVDVYAKVRLEDWVFGGWELFLTDWWVRFFRRFLNEEVLLVGDQARWKNTNVAILAEINGGCPFLIVEEVVQGDLVHDEAFPSVEPFVADHVPDVALALEGVTGLLSLYHEFALEFPTILDGFDLCGGDLIRPVDQVLVEY